MNQPADLGSDMNKRKKVMQTRLKKLGTANPVVERAVKKNNPEREGAYDDFDIVHELVSAAYAKYAESDEPLSECLLSLADALKKAAGNTDDEEDTSDEADDEEESDADEEDY